VRSPKLHVRLLIHFIEIYLHKSSLNINDVTLEFR
jgi:hypothetical protein